MRTGTGVEVSCPSESTWQFIAMECSFWCSFWQNSLSDMELYLPQQGPTGFWWLLQHISSVLFMWIG